MKFVCSGFMVGKLVTTLEDIVIYVWEAFSTRYLRKQQEEDIEQNKLILK